MNKNSFFKKSIFFDRDGTLINIPLVKNGKPKSFNNLNQVYLYKDTIEICKILKKKKYSLFLFTNQPDVTRNKNSKVNVDNINKFIKKKLSLDDILISYSDDEKNFYRKPNPGMLLYAKNKFGIDLAKSYVIGDRWRDINAGIAAGCKTIFIDKSYPEKLKKKPKYVVKNFRHIIRYIK